ncbi:MAG: hydrogenase maturation protease [Bryobacteraceae bacterium]
MKPLLVIGLGNPLMGDEGIGWHVAERLSGDPRLPAEVEVVCGGTDLLRHAGRMEQRRRVIVVDALRDDAEPGSVCALEAPAGLDNRQDNVHCLSAIQAIQLLRMTVPVPITLLGISVPCACVQSDLSPELAARMPAILDRVLRELDVEY